MKTDRICGRKLCRPGGFIATDMALKFCDFKKGAKLADIGCGYGATVRYIKSHYGFDICGIDKDPSICDEINSQEKLVITADAENLPFADKQMDGLLFECSLSKMKEPDNVLTECYRVLKDNGYLIISDLYARGKEANLSGILGRIDAKKTITDRLQRHHFSPRFIEDFTESMRKIWGQMLFDYGPDELYSNIRADGKILNEIKCGYCLIVAQKETR
jgi:arsenite methyltransferase